MDAPCGFVGLQNNSQMRAEVPPHGQRKHEQPKSVHNVKLDNCRLAMIVVHQHSLNRQPIVVSTFWVQEFGPSIVFYCVCLWHPLVDSVV